MFIPSNIRLAIGVAAATLGSALPSLAQPSSSSPRAVAAADYARAETFMGYNTNPLVLRSGVHPTWLGEGDERFWYRVTTERGVEAVLIDPKTANRSACTLPACTQALRERTERGGSAARMESRSPDGKSVAFVRDWNLWVRDVASGRETALTTDGAKD